MSANNEMGASQSMFWRAIYQTEAFSNGGMGGPAIKDLNYGEFRYYGKLDTEGNVIVPISNKMMTLKSNSSQKQLFALPLVSILHNDVKTNMAFQRNFGRIVSDCIEMLEVEPVRGFENPIENYTNYSIPL